MHKRLLRFTYILLILSIFAGIKSTHAQVYRLSQHWKIGGFIGATKFYGDLSDNTNSFINNTPFSSYFYQDRKAAGALFIEKWFTPFVGARFMYFGGDLQSTQESTKQYFKARYIDYSLSLSLDFSSLIWGPDPGRNVRFYGFGGLGFSRSQTNKYDMKTDKIIGTSGYGEPKRSGKGVQPLSEMVIPTGIGLSFFASNTLSVNIEGHLHFVMTNMIDATPVEGTNFENVGFISIGIVYNFNMNGLRIGGGNYKTFEGRSNDPALREFNRRKRVVMVTKYNKKAFKKRKKFKHQRY
jgi:hypothetical protein